MKLPRFSVRELVAWIAVVALSIGWAMEHSRAKRLQLELDTTFLIDDLELEHAEATIARLRAELAECDSNFERVDAELRKLQEAITGVRQRNN